MDHPKQDTLSSFLEALDLQEQPMGTIFTDEEPEEGLSPNPMELVTAEKESRNEIDWKSVFENHSCIIKNIWMARKKNTAAYFDSERYGCPGAAFFLGFTKPQLETIISFVSTGIPNVMPGERYIESPEVARQVYKDMDPVPAPKRFCVFRPVSQFARDQKPDTVTFFARPEAIAGLYCLAFFVTNDPEVVKSPVGSGCAQMISYPFKYLKEGKLKAVLGGWDPSCRPFLQTDELSFTVPYEMYEKMLQRWPESFLSGPAWGAVKQKIARSHRIWEGNKESATREQ